MEDLINAPRVGLPDGQHVEQQVLGDTDQVPEGPPEEELRQVAYLRLRVRACTAEQAAVWGRERVMDFEFGPMGAPPEYPRVSINDLFRHAAETA
ncbi:MAG TPA: hypothetical protein VFG94_02295 [Acidimicrobiales bacterium]|nr:hypothetical protein [Acidimicrobiales bacterium]